MRVHLLSRLIVASIFLMQTHVIAADVHEPLNYLGVDDTYTVLHESKLLEEYLVEHSLDSSILIKLEDAALDLYDDSQEELDRSLEEVFAELNSAELLLLAIDLVRERGDDDRVESDAESLVELMRSVAADLDYVEDPVQLLAHDHAVIQHMALIDAALTEELLKLLQTYDWLLGDPDDEHELVELTDYLLADFAVLDVIQLAAELLRDELHWSELCEEADDEACRPGEKSKYSGKHSKHKDKTEASDKSEKLKNPLKDKHSGKNKLSHSGKPFEGVKSKLPSGKSKKTPNGNDKKSGGVFGGGPDVAHTPGHKNPIPTPYSNTSSSGSHKTTVKIEGKVVLGSKDKVNNSSGDESGSSNNMVKSNNMSGGSWGINHDVDVGKVMFEAGGGGSGGTEGGLTQNEHEDPEDPGSAIAKPMTHDGMNGGANNGQYGLNPNGHYFTPKDFDPRINYGPNGKPQPKRMQGEHNPPDQGGLINPGDKVQNKGPKQLTNADKRRKTKKEKLINIKGKKSKKNTAKSKKKKKKPSKK